MKRVWGMGVAFLFATGVWGQDPSVLFQEKQPGIFHFQTDALTGWIRADGKSQGIPSLVFRQSGQEIAFGGEHPGLFSLYRIFTRGKRYGDAVRDWPSQNRLLPNGALQLNYPSQAEHPFTLKAKYQWKEPRVLDFEITVEAKTRLVDFEVFLSSYFHSNFDASVYVRPTIHKGGKPAFIAVDVNPLLEGTYLAFPRDEQAVQLLFDGRWTLGLHPVDFSIPRFYAEPVAIRQDVQSGLTVMMFSHKEDCFAIETPYNMTPPDGVAAHKSMYLSLFGTTLSPGQKATAHVRMVVEQNPTPPRILALYDRFKQEK